ncbi:unnamed protein product [Closterium sp. NIES-54]
MEERATTGPSEGSASRTGTGVGRGLRVVQSQKKQREAPESSVKVCKASAGAVPGREDSPAPRAGASIPGSGGTHRGLASTLLPLPLASSRTSTLSFSPTATTATAATTATPTTASTAATNAPTPSTTPTTATTSTAAIASTAAPTTTLAAPSTTPATLALAAAALRTSRSSPDILSTKDVYSSCRGIGGGKGGGGAPLKEGRARSATSSTYRYCTSPSCKEVLLE